MECENLSDYLEEDIFSALEAWESAANSYNTYNNNNSESGSKEEIISFEFQKSSPSGNYKYYSETDVELGSPQCKRQKKAVAAEGGGDDFQAEEPRMNHISVERNRRKQMNDNLSLLRSLMPSFYVKRGDQASIIGGVVDYITELQHLIQSLEAKKQRKSYCDILSPRPVSSPKPSPISPRKPPLSPRLSLPVSPRTPQPSSPYKPYVHAAYPIGSPSPRAEASPCNSSNASAVNELAASSRSAVAEVEVKFSGPNLVLKTVSRRAPGQAVRIVAALEELDLEILHVKISVVDEKVLNSFTIKIGIECHLSAEELAHQIHQTFC